MARTPRTRSGDPSWSPWEAEGALSPFAQRKGTRSEANAGVCPGAGEGQPGFPRSRGKCPKDKGGASGRRRYPPPPSPVIPNETLRQPTPSHYPTSTTLMTHA